MMWWTTARSRHRMCQRVIVEQRTPKKAIGVTLSLFRRLDVRFANDTTKFIKFFANECTEIRAAYAGWIDSLTVKFCNDLRRPHRRGEPVGELRDCVLRRVRRRDHPVPEVQLVILVA